MSGFPKLFDALLRVINGCKVPAPFPLYTAKMKIALLNVPTDIVVFVYDPEVKEILVDDD
jgi:hypothetical protein